MFNNKENNKENKNDNNYVTGSIFSPKIINGATLKIGERDGRNSVILKVGQHFNKFQKIMWKLCFGVTVEDYSD